MTDELPRSGRSIAQESADRVQAAREFAIRAHRQQRYGSRPYVVHLDEVAELLQPFGEEALVVGYLHDVIEDTEVLLGEVWLAFGPRVALAVLLVSDERPAPRAERKAWINTKLAAAGGEDRIALMVKTADRLANVSACIRDGDTGRLNQYQREHAAFRQSAYRPALCDPLWQRLDQLLHGTESSSIARPGV